MRERPTLDLEKGKNICPFTRHNTNGSGQVQYRALVVTMKFTSVSYMQYTILPIVFSEILTV